MDTPKQLGKPLACFGRFFDRSSHAQQGQKVFVVTGQCDEESGAGAKFYRAVLSGHGCDISIEQ